MIKKRTMIAFGLGAATTWFADPVSGRQRRADARRMLDTADARAQELRERLPDDTERAIRELTLPDVGAAVRSVIDRDSADESHGPAPIDPTSLSELLATAHERGARTDMSPTPAGMVRCGGCGGDSRPEDLTRDWVHRLEGTSDPDELLTASAVTCPRCGGTGVLVLPFGPLADEVEAQIARSLPEPSGGERAPMT